METCDFIMILAGLAGVIELVILSILIFKFIQATSDIKLLRENICQPKQDFQVEFYTWIVANEISKAKEILFNEISLEKSFKSLLNGGNDTYFQELSVKLNNKYKKELQIIGIDNVDFSKMKN